MVGDQSVPSKKSNTPISAIEGRPFANKNQQMSRTARIEAKAQVKNTPCMIFSFSFAIDKLHSFSNFLLISAKGLPMQTLYTKKIGRCMKISCLLHRTTLLLRQYKYL